MTNLILNISKSEVANTINVDVPLFIRLLEFAREDATTDMQLHVLTERLITLSGPKAMTMKDYDALVKGLV